MTYLRGGRCPAMLALLFFALLAPDRADHRDHGDRDDRQQGHHEEDEPAGKAPRLVQPEGDPDRRGDKKEWFGNTHERASLPCLAHPLQQAVQREVAKQHESRATRTIMRPRR